ncbi:MULTISPECIES: DUF4410 domain-containing protein [unclassified Luteimonas]
MKAFHAILLGALLAGCSTTSVVHQPYTAADNQKYSFEIKNNGDADAEGLGTLERHLGQKLRERGLFADGGDAVRVEVTLTHFRLRSDGARLWAGIMAGRDKVASTVRLLAPDGRVVGHFDVETFNASAWLTSAGLLENHATEIVDRLQ